MSNEKKQGEGVGAVEQQTAAAYEAPRVETVLSAEDVEREALYGGISQM
jgi:hypothetical protein